MKSILIENDGNGQKAYNSMLLEPKDLRIFANELALNMVKELSRKPGCAMDLARKLEVDEQKIYYHLRKLEGAGIVKLLGTETRYGMTAKIYKTMSPVVSAKLYEDGHELEKGRKIIDPDTAKFFSPFVKNGRLNALVIIGDVYSHGKFDAIAREGPHAFDLAMMLGNLVNELSFPHFKLDTEVGEKDLKNNLILIGNSKANIIVDKINQSLPLRFDERNDFAIVSEKSGNVYNGPRLGVIIKTKNPFNSKKKILVLGGRTSGTKAAIVACTKHISKVIKGLDKRETAIVVSGFDKDGDKIIDDVKVLE